MSGASLTGQNTLKVIADKNDAYAIVQDIKIWKGDYKDSWVDSEGTLVQEKRKPDYKMFSYDNPDNKTGIYRKDVWPSGMKEPKEIEGHTWGETLHVISGEISAIRNECTNLNGQNIGFSETKWNSKWSSSHFDPSLNQRIVDRVFTFKVSGTGTQELQLGAECNLPVEGKDGITLKPYEGVYLSTSQNPVTYIQNDNGEKPGTISGGIKIDPTSFSVPGDGIYKIYFQGYIGDSEDFSNDIKDGVWWSKTELELKGDSARYVKPSSMMVGYAVNVQSSGAVGVRKTAEAQEISSETGSKATYHLSLTSTKMKVEDVFLMDVLPYDGDSRGSHFHGTYSIADNRILLKYTGKNAKEAKSHVELYYTTDLLVRTAKADIFQGTTVSLGTGEFTAAGITWYKAEQERGVCRLPQGIVPTGIVMIGHIEANEKLTAMISLELLGQKKGDVYSNECSSWSKDLNLIESNIVSINVVTPEVGYKVEHYKQQNDGSYLLTETDEELFGEIGDIVTAVPKKYKGYAVNNERSEISGTVFRPVKDEGELKGLVLKVYYDGNVKVSYKYNGSIPDGAPAVPEEKNSLLPGTCVQVAGIPAVEGWKFIGWSVVEPDDGSVEIQNDNQLVVGTEDVVLTGTWLKTIVPIDPHYAIYKVEHYKQQEDGGYTLADIDFPLYGEIGKTVSADMRKYEGYSVNTEKSTMSGNIIKPKEENGELKFLILTVFYDRDHTQIPPIPEKKTGNLTISKEVCGNQGEKERDFNFIVVLGDPEISGTYGNIDFRNGTATFTLKHGENKTAKGLPLGVIYEVKETDADRDGYTTICTGGTGVITEDGAQVSFINRREKDTSSSNPDPSPTPDPDSTEKVGSLIISKFVSGSQGERWREFTFQITLSDDSVNGVYGDLEFEYGKAIFRLKHGDNRIVSGLPAGIGYKVEESDNAGYEVTKSGDIGYIIPGKSVRAVFHNFRGGNSDDEEDDQSVTSTIAPKVDEITEKEEKRYPMELETLTDLDLPESIESITEPDISSYSKEKTKNVPKMGDKFDSGFWWVIMAISCIGGCAFFVLYLRKKAKEKSEN